MAVRHVAADFSDRVLTIIMKKPEIGLSKSAQSLIWSITLHTGLDLGAVNCYASV